MNDNQLYNKLLGLKRKLDKFGHFDFGSKEDKNIFNITHDLETKNFNAFDMYNMMKALKHNLQEKSRKEKDCYESFQSLGGDEELQRLALKLGRKCF